MALADSYRRVSSGGQAQSDKSGLQSQEQALKDWMRRHPDYWMAEELLDPDISLIPVGISLRGLLVASCKPKNRNVPWRSVLVVEAQRCFSRQDPLDAPESLIRDVWGQGLGFSVFSYQAGSPLFMETTGAQDLAMLAFLFA